MLSMESKRTQSFLVYMSKTLTLIILLKNENFYFEVYDEKYCYVVERVTPRMQLL